MTQRLIFVAEITLTVDNVGTQETFYFSTSGFTTKPGDTPPNTVVREYLEDPGTLRRELFSGARIRGPVRPAFGQIVLSNHSGVLDDWIGYGISGGRVEVRYGPEGSPYPAGFSTVYIGYAYSVIVDFDRVRVLLRDLLYRLEEPVVDNIFAGSGGLEGTGIANRKKQLAFGQPGYFPPILVDADRRIYFVQGNAADNRAITQSSPPLYGAFEGGLPIPFDGYYKTEEALFSDAPAPGTFKIYGPNPNPLAEETDETQGPVYIRLGSENQFDIRFYTLGLLKESASTPARQWTFLDLLARAGIPSELAPGSYVKNVGNYLVDADQSYLDVMTDAASVSFSSYGFDRLGRFFTIDLLDPSEGSDPSVFTFDLNNSREIKRQPVPGAEAPVWQVSVSVGRTWPSSSLRPTLTSAQRELFERGPWQSSFTGTSFSVRAANPGAETAQVQLTGNELQGISPKLGFVQRYLYLFGSRRELITLTSPLTAESMALDLHQKVTVRMNRFGCQLGRVFRIVSIDLNCRARTITFGLWGGPPGPSDTVLGGGGAGGAGGGGGTGVFIDPSAQGRIGNFRSLAYGFVSTQGLGGTNPASAFAPFRQVAYGSTPPGSSGSSIILLPPFLGSGRGTVSAGEPPLEDPEGSLVAFDASSSAIGARIARSTDGGLTWTQVPVATGPNPGRTITYKKLWNNEEVVTTDTRGVIHRKNGVWTRILTVLPDNLIHQLAVKAVNLLYTHGANGVPNTYDGTSWVNIQSTTQGNSNSLTYCINTDLFIVCAATIRTSATMLSPLTTRYSNGSIPARRVLGINGSYVLANAAVFSAPFYLIRSLDGGLTWSTIEVVGAPNFIDDAARNPITGNWLAVTASPGTVYRSLNGTGAWGATGGTLPGAPGTTYRLLWNDTEFLALVQQGSSGAAQIYFSTDEGDTWTLRSTLPGNYRGLTRNTFAIG